LSDEHFTVDGTLIEAWSGQKSFKGKGKSLGPGIAAVTLGWTLAVILILSAAPHF